MMRTGRERGPNYGWSSGAVHAALLMIRHGGAGLPSDKCRSRFQAVPIVIFGVSDVPCHLVRFPARSGAESSAARTMLTN
jgi:hypothetical protein